ncbi:MAG: hypothetical protein KAI70_00775 [Candidatus Omnitrophica bacterium]|nr:hypothetical protein [Candidatus Omnitrophota bacterium]
MNKWKNVNYGNGEFVFFMNEIECNLFSLWWGGIDTITIKEALPEDGGNDGV